MPIIYSNAIMQPLSLPKIESTFVLFTIVRLWLPW